MSDFRAFGRIPLASLVRAASLLLVLAAALAPPSAAEAADDLHTLKVRLDWLPSGYQAPLLLAVEKGWYKEAGLDVSIVSGNGSAMTAQLVGSGEFDIGHAALSNMAFARSKGVPIISVAGFFRKGDLALIVPVDSPIRVPADIKGKRLLYTAGSLESPFLDAFFAKAGLTRDAVTLLSVDASAKASTYVSGSVDGVFSTALLTGQVNPGRPSRVILFADYGLNLPGFGLFTRTSTLDTKADAVRLFASISSGAWDYVAKGHEPEALAALMTVFANERVDEQQMRDQLAGAVDFLYSKATRGQPVGIQSDADWADAIALMEKAKAIEPGSKPADYYTNKYLDLALMKEIAAK